MSSSSLKIIFAGTPEFAATILQSLISYSTHDILGVYTQPDRPAGRGRQLTASAVKETASLYNLPIFQPESLRNPEEQKKIMELQPDLLVVVAYGLLLPKEILTIPKLGCINVHASLLPRWRGAAPIQRAILAGDSETGITIMQMAEGLDTGDMLYKSPCAIENNDTSGILHDRLAKLGAEALLTVLSDFHAFTPEPQNNADATYASKIKKEEGLLDWNLSAIELDRKIRAFNPWPVAFFNNIRIWRAEVVNEKKSEGEPGTILEASPKGIDIATGSGVLSIVKLQLPGGRVISANDLINSHKNLFVAGQNLRDIKI